VEEVGKTRYGREDVRQGQPSRARPLGSLATPMEEVMETSGIWKERRKLNLAGAGRDVGREDVRQGQPSRARPLGSLATPMEEVVETSGS
jgi:hypothetical protein